MPPGLGQPAVVDRDQEPLLTPDAARRLTEEVKSDAAALWAKLRALYEGEAHIALGYSSWGDYFEEEFGRSGNYGYRLLKSAEVMEQLPMGNSRPVSERVARELVPLLSEPEGTLEEVWAEVIARHGEPTAEQTAAVVSASASVNGHRSKRAARDCAADAAPDVLAVVILGRAPRILWWQPLPQGARSHAEAVPAESENPRVDDFSDLDMEHAERLLAATRPTKDSRTRCRCPRPLGDGEGGCVHCGRELPA